MDGESDASYDPGKQVAIDDLMKKDADDESLRKYKEALLGSEVYAPKDDPRKCVITQFEILFEDRPGGNLTFKTEDPADLKRLAEEGFKLKEKCKYKLRITFRVQHQILSGLRMITKIKRKVFSHTDKTMLGSYRPQKEPHVILSPQRGWEETPSGAIAKGKYKANVTFVDDDKNTHLEFTYAFEISADW